MRLVCPTAFKGTLSPLEAARLLMEPGDRLLPLSDGGNGFLECLHSAKGGTWQETRAADPFGREKPVAWLQLPDGTACVESALVIGLAGLDRRDPLAASSRGLGDLLRTITATHPPRLWVGLGGSATVDGGRDWPELVLPPTTAFCDVATDLADAARIFGPQKGAKKADVPLLTERLMGLCLPRGPYTGAAGGLGAKLASLGAQLVDGAEEMMKALGFDEALAGCDSVLTGEGRLDASTLEGKLPWRVALRAHVFGLPVIGRFGSYGPGWEAAAEAFDELIFGDPRHEGRLTPML
ncbi:MAG TPA: glycerate kinase [Holophagaceae bacterium]|nr:glycerate kinase [Holophagaceae bacterium]